MGEEDVISPADFTNLKKYTIYSKLLIGGMPSRVFSASTFPPIRFKNEGQEQKKETVLRIVREKYAKPVEFVESKIKEISDKAGEDEKKLKEREIAFKEKIKEEKLAKKAGDRVAGLLADGSVETVRVQAPGGEIFEPRPERTPAQIGSPRTPEQKNPQNDNRPRNPENRGNNQPRRD
jgi:hypothetical protein